MSVSLVEFPEPAVLFEAVAGVKLELKGTVGDLSAAGVVELAGA